MKTDRIINKTEVALRVRSARLLGQADAGGVTVGDGGGETLPAAARRTGPGPQRQTARGGEM